MTGQEILNNYITAKQAYNDARKAIDLHWLARKLCPLYVASAGYIEITDIQHIDDRYKITYDWTCMGDTEYGETFTINGHLLGLLCSKETRDEAYKQLKAIKDEEKRIREEEQRKQCELAQLEQEKCEKEQRRKQYEELKKEFGDT